MDHLILPRLPKRSLPRHLIFSLIMSFFTAGDIGPEGVTLKDRDEGGQHDSYIHVHTANHGTYEANSM